MTAIQKIITFFLALGMAAIWSQAAPVGQTGRLHSAGRIDDSSTLLWMNVFNRNGEEVTQYYADKTGVNKKP